MVLVALSAFCKLQRPHLSELFILSVAIFTSQYHAFYTPAVGITAHTQSEQLKSAVWIPTGEGSSSVFFALLPRKVTGLAAAHSIRRGVPGTRAESAARSARSLAVSGITDAPHRMFSQPLRTPFRKALLSRHIF